MTLKALKSLEFNKIIEMLKNRAVSPMAKEKCEILTPFTNLADISRAQKETTEATGIILRKGSLPLGGIKDIRALIARAAAGGMLHAEDFLQISGCLYVFGKLSNYYDSESVISLRDYFTSITPCDALEQEISRCIKDSGEISDNASQKLAEVRRSIRKSQDNIRDKLQGIIQSASYKNMLQDAIVTLRGERFCVPVKAEYRGSFPGMVHDQSGTGATVFMEPLSVIELNNKIKELHFEEKREEEKILYKLSGMVSEVADILDANIAIAVQLDFIFAKGELSLQMRATEPIFNQRGYVNIRKGRHPLLDAQAVVPTDIILGGEFSMLLITGPNTGGKTVTLKTIGLFTLMGQAGLHIPAFDNSELAVFDDVFADIGDEQSIEQSLSTFSSHLTNIVEILEKLSENALVLLDELGAGTDPTEGAALAIALLSYLHSRKIRTVVTTHYSELKLYALSTEGVENASCEFNVETLRPTYRLLIGIPGKSNAFAIAKRLGLPVQIIDEARALLSQKDIRFEDVITDLEASKKQVLIEQDRAAVYAREAEKLRTDAAKLEEKLRTQREKILQQAREEAVEVVRDARKEANEILSQIRDRMDSMERAEVESARKQMREGLNALESAISPISEKPTRKPPENLRRGDRVHIHSLNQSGTILNPPDSHGETQIQAGIMKIKVNVSDLSLDEQAPEEKAATFIKNRQNSSTVKSLNISPETDLRGLLPEDAVNQAERYLDEAFLASLSTVTLIHGKGTGVLRTAIHTMLKRQPNVKNFRLGKYGEGEDGVTIVTFG
ncbi:MAG: endonuclease MutS2 [Defluviitaleaceae bacterium]|nr:endonuclease MutS2 [Defluviitaleaceae bacterium]MCL2263123.1 endonuclease MutS2 [Defluviitaleaceae bacterium]